MTKNPPSLNALAKRVCHPKWKSVEDIVEILERGVSHPLWHRTRVNVDAANDIKSKILSLPASQDPKILHRLDRCLGTIEESRYYLAVSQKHRTLGLGLLVRHEIKHGQTNMPWTSSVIVNLAGGANRIRVLCNETYEAWVERGDDKRAALKMGLVHVQALRHYLSQKDQAQNSTQVRNILFQLDQMAKTHPEGIDLVGRSIAKLNIQNADDWRQIKQTYNLSVPIIDSMLAKHWLTQNHIIGEGKSSSPVKPKL